MKKMLVAAVALAALVLASCSNGMVANDRIDSPDVKAVATENGVIVLSWEAVKDVASYNVTVKNPGSEEFSSDAISNVTTSNGRNSVTYNVYEKDTEYTFKVVAVASKANVLSAETEVTVKTPEEWKDLTIDAAKIKLSLNGNTKNTYGVFIPTDYGYDYTVKATIDATLDPKVAFNKATTTVASKDGSTVVQVIKAEEVDGETTDVVQSVWVNTISATNDTPKYVVVKATPKNGQIGKTVYAISKDSVKKDWTDAFGTPANVAVTKESATTARVTFTAAQINNADVKAESFAIYRAATKYINALRATETGAYAKVGTAKLANAAYYDNAAQATVDAKYYFDDTIEAFKSDKDGVASYTYFILNEDGVASAGVTLDNSSVGATVAQAIAGTATTGNFSYTTDSANTGAIVKLLGVQNGATVTLKVAKYATEAAAKANVMADFTTTVPMTVTAKNYVQIANDTTDGVKSTTVSTDYETALQTMEIAATSSSATSSVTSGVTTTSTTTTEAKNSGAWYVYQAEIKNGNAVTYKYLYLKRTSSTTTSGPNVTTHYNVTTY